MSIQFPPTGWHQIPSGESALIDDPQNQNSPRKQFYVTNNFRWPIEILVKDNTYGQIFVKTLPPKNLAEKFSCVLQSRGYSRLITSFYYPSITQPENPKELPNLVKKIDSMIFIFEDLESFAPGVIIENIPFSNLPAFTPSVSMKMSEEKAK
ncbi:MAG: hypothetical protein V4487_05800 [Chlamydiota bacterium]